MRKRTLRIVLGDQLSAGLAGLRDIDKTNDVVVMAEVASETDYVPHHPQKIAFVLSAMQHFADELRADGVDVDYTALDAPGNPGSLRGAVLAAVKRHRPERIVATLPGEWRVLADMDGWQEASGVPVEIREDERFLCSRAAFARHAHGRKQLRMEFFYREMRRKSGLLMDGDDPVGGQWNFDAQNRKAIGAKTVAPPEFAVAPDATTKTVLELVGQRFKNNFGDLDGFGFAVARADALRALAHFVRFGLASFGDYQDAMREGDDLLFHSLLSPYLNVGLLDPLEVCRAAEDAYRAGAVPLNAAEGFVRQILGWREFMRGIYWLKMPDYAATNALDATRSLPELYWGAPTDMRCLAQCVGQTKRRAYAHHIQRLMVTGNFALLAGIAPAEVERWYLAVYADAFEWVELPNVHGMALHADGGLLASKPYAASGKYIDRMSNYCTKCRFDPKDTDGPDACPFNYLYWNFLIANRAHFAGNPRMGLMYAALARMPPERQRSAVERATALLDRIAPKRG
jgi:deoxyribodipyrimidine photolyase-related protein